MQLGEQAIKLDSTSGLDELKDAVSGALGSKIATSSWNGHKEDFLNKWDTQLASKVAKVEKVDVSELEDARRQLKEAEAKVTDLSAAADRLRGYSKQLTAQNSELRRRVEDPPPPPELEGDENAGYIAEAETAIERAAGLMNALAAIVQEALFQKFRDDQPLNVGGYRDSYTVEAAQEQEELGRLEWVEDGRQQVLPREDHPQVAAASEALKRVRELAFEGVPFENRSEAGDWIKPYLKEKCGIDDPVFELRPVWEALDFL